MAGFSPAQLARWTGGRWTTVPGATVTGFSADTRRLGPGEMFVALRADRRDGHDFLAAAQTAGAPAALVARADAASILPQLVVSDPLAALQAVAREHRRNFRGPVVGISGTAGKTSTKDLLALLLGDEAAGVLATTANLNNHLGVPLTLTQIDPERHRFVVIEAGVAVPGEMHSLADMIEPDLTIITLIAPAHTAALGGVDGVAREKAVLVAATRTSGVAIFSRATAEHSPFRDLGVRTMIVERAEVVRPAEPPPDRTYFTLAHRDDETAVAIAYGPPPPLTFSFRRVSDGMAQNAVLAICSALWLGATPAAIRRRLALWRPVRLRGEIRREDGRLLYLDCYNANPASMADALKTFAAIAPAGEPRLYVIGCMEELGAAAAAHHHALGRSLPMRDGDRLLVIGPHAAEICAGVLATGDFSRQLQIVSSLDPMAEAFAGWRGAVFVKGSRCYRLEGILEQQTLLPLSP